MATTRVLLVQAACSALAFGAVVLVNSPYVVLAAFTVLGSFVLGFTGMYYSCMSTLVGDDEMGRAIAGGQLTLNGGALLGPPPSAFSRISWATIPPGSRSASRR